MRVSTVAVVVEEDRSIGAPTAEHAASIRHAAETGVAVQVLIAPGSVALLTAPSTAGTTTAIQATNVREPVVYLKAQSTVAHTIVSKEKNAGRAGARALLTTPLIAVVTTVPPVQSAAAATNVSQLTPSIAAEDAHVLPAKCVSAEEPSVERINRLLKRNATNKDRCSRV
jgi:hypothetical protein